MTRNTSSASTSGNVNPRRTEKARKTIVLALATVVPNIIVEFALEDRVNERRNVLDDLDENEKDCEQDERTHHWDQPPASSALDRELIEFEQRLKWARHTRYPRRARLPCFLIPFNIPFNNRGVHNPLFSWPMTVTNSGNRPG